MPKIATMAYRHNSEYCVKYILQAATQRFSVLRQWHRVFLDARWLDIAYNASCYIALPCEVLMLQQKANSVGTL